MSSPLSAGNTIETRCTRCKGVLNHSIVAMVGDKIVRVECSTCHGVHAYHPPKATKAPSAAKAGTKKAATPRKTKVDPETVARAEWEVLRMFMSSAQAIPYNMDQKFKLKDVMSHATFGLGIVQLVILPNKIDVLFQTGKKRLRCG